MQVEDVAALLRPALQPPVLRADGSSSGEAAAPLPVVGVFLTSSAIYVACVLASLKMG